MWRREDEGGGCGEERMKGEGVEKRGWRRRVWRREDEGGRVWRREDEGGGCGEERMKGEGVEERGWRGEGVEKRG